MPNDALHDKPAEIVIIASTKTYKLITNYRNLLYCSEKTVTILYKSI